jgi:hypothetical protein
LSKVSRNRGRSWNVLPVDKGALLYTHRAIQEQSAILWEMVVCVILSKKVHMNMGPILDGYRDYGEKKIRTVLASTNSNYVINNVTTNVTCMQVLTIVLLIICNGQNPGWSTSGTSHNKFSKMLPPTSMQNQIQNRTHVHMNFFCLESHILSFPKVLQIPPVSPCIHCYS